MNATSALRNNNTKTDAKTGDLQKAASFLDSRYVASRPSRGFSSGIWRFAASLPDFPACTLGEGSTPLLPLDHIARLVGGGRFLGKLECFNPTGSFKDRGSALIAAAARHAGATSLALASTGNAGASMAAYAARAGIPLKVLAPKSIDPGKLWQINAHGAEIELVDGDFAACQKAYAGLVAEGAFASGSDNPLRQEGTKTVAYELFEEFGVDLDRVIAPVGTGGLIVSLRMGFQEIAAAVPGFRIPAIDVVQLEVLNPLSGFDADRKAVRTAATGINIANPTLRDVVVSIVKETGGNVYSVSEDELLGAQELLARSEGVGAEPTGSVTTAAYMQARRDGRIKSHESVVAIVTGHILKAPVQIVDRRTSGARS